MFNHGTFVLVSPTQKVVNPVPIFESVYVRQGGMIKQISSDMGPI